MILAIAIAYMIVAGLLAGGIMLVKGYKIMEDLLDGE